jgi:hypothetical protein
LLEDANRNHGGTVPGFPPNYLVQSVTVAAIIGQQLHKPPAVIEQPNLKTCPTEKPKL